GRERALSSAVNCPTPMDPCQSVWSAERLDQGASAAGGAVVSGSDEVRAEGASAPNQTPAITISAPVVPRQLSGSSASHASSSIVTTGNRTKAYEVAEAVQRRTTSSIRTNSPTEPSVTR